MKALIVCALVGELDQLSPGILADYSIAVAVDAGAQWFRRHGIVPDFAVGDFDSISTDTLAWLEASQAQIQGVSSDKDFSDLELALSVCAEQGVQSATIIGAVGGRIDHQLCVLGALLRSTVPELTLQGNNQTIKLLRAGDHLTLNSTSITFSVLSIEGAMVSITGARWPLDYVTLKPLSTHGLSNERSIQTSTIITVHDGNAFVIFSQLH